MRLKFIIIGFLSFLIIVNAALAETYTKNNAPIAGNGPQGIITCDNNDKRLSCQDSGTGQNHGCDYHGDNGCRAWENEKNHGVAGCLITCERISSNDKSGPATACNGYVAYNGNEGRYAVWNNQCSGKLQASGSGGIGQGCCELACGASTDCDEQAPTGACQSCSLVMCTQDVRQCQDGSFVKRVPPDCNFEKCPTIVLCPQDIQQCPDGSYVKRVPPDCNFEKCPTTIGGTKCNPPLWDDWKVDACWDEGGNANCGMIQDVANWWCRNSCGQTNAVGYTTAWIEGVGTKYVPTGRTCSSCSYHFSSISCSSCVSNQGQSCNKCGTIDCYGVCANQGACSPGETRCSNNKYQTCSSGCQWQNSGTDADNDGVDRQCGDSQCDNSPGMTDATKTGTETACTDGLDNDCDVRTDCNDNDCDGSITGAVKSDNKPIAQADVTAKKDLTTVKTTTTNQQGSYNIGISCGTYNLVVSHPDYAPKTVSNLNIPPKQQVTQDFNLVIGTACEPDCTYASDEIVHAECAGKNGCSFFDNNAKTMCNNAQPGWVREYNSTHYVICPFGSPQSNIEIEASVSCESGTLIKMTRIVVYNGKPVKLVVVTCG